MRYVILVPTTVPGLPNMFIERFLTREEAETYIEQATNKGEWGAQDMYIKEEVYTDPCPWGMLL
jgi:hypothetical protein